MAADAEVTGRVSHYGSIETRSGGGFQLRASANRFRMSIHFSTRDEKNKQMVEYCERVRKILPKQLDKMFGEYRVRLFAHRLRGRRPSTLRNWRVSVVKYLILGLTTDTRPTGFSAFLSYSPPNCKSV